MNHINEISYESVVLITGASGYVGGRLVSRIDRQRYRVRCLARRPDLVRDRLPDDIDIVEGDVLDQTGKLIGERLLVKLHRLIETSLHPAALLFVQFRAELSEVARRFD